MPLKILLRCDYASVALPVHGDVDTWILSRSKQLPWGGDHEDSGTLLLRHRRFYCALAVSATIRVYDLGASTALLPFLLRFVSFSPKFLIVVESPSSGMGVLQIIWQTKDAMCLKYTYVCHQQILGGTVSSVCRVPDPWSQGRGFESHQGRSVVLGPCSFLVLVPARKMSPHDWKIVNFDAKPQSEQRKTLHNIFFRNITQL